MMNRCLFCFSRYCGFGCRCSCNCKNILNSSDPGKFEWSDKHPVNNQNCAEKYEIQDDSSEYKENVQEWPYYSVENAREAAHCVKAPVWIPDDIEKDCIREDAQPTDGTEKVEKEMEKSEDIVEAAEAEEKTVEAAEVGVNTEESAGVEEKADDEADVQEYCIGENTQTEIDGNQNDIRNEAANEAWIIREEQYDGQQFRNEVISNLDNTGELIISDLVQEDSYEDKPSIDNWLFLNQYDQEIECSDKKCRKKSVCGCKKCSLPARCGFKQKKQNCPCRKNNGLPARIMCNSIKSSNTGGIILPDNTRGGTTYNVASINIDTYNCNNFYIHLNFVCNISITNAMLYLRFYILKHGSCQYVSTPVSSGIIFSRENLSSGTNTLSFQAWDSDSMGDKCCNYSVYVEVMGNRTVGTVSITNSIIAASMIDKAR